MSRTNNSWKTGIGGTYIQTISPSGYDILINGSNKYLNFDSIVGSTGYGFRDNGGVMEVKDSGGSWAAFSTLGGAGTLAGVSAGSTDTAKSLYTMTSGVDVNFQRSAGASLLYLNEVNGRIGIGTTTPGKTLDIGNYVRLWQGYGGNAAVSSASGYGLLLFPEGSQTMTLGKNQTYSGGAVNVSNPAGQSNIMQWYDSTDALVASVSNTGTITTKNLDAGGSAFYVSQSTGKSTLYNAGVLGWTASASANTTADTGLSRGAANKIYVGNGTSGDYSGTLIAGNVGIGTSSPAYKLQIKTTAASGLWSQIQNETSSSYSAFAVGNNVNATRLTFYALGSTYGSSGQYQANKSLIESVGDLYINSSGGNTLFYSGNVGIGTTTTTGKLTVASSTSNVAALNLNNPSNSTSLDIYVGDGSQISSGQVAFRHASINAIVLKGSTSVSFGSNTWDVTTNANTLTLRGGYGGAVIGTSLRLQSNSHNQGVYSATSGTQTTLIMGNGSNESWSPSSGTATYNLVNLNPVINTTGTYSGTIRALYISPTLTSVTGASFRAIEMTNDSGYGVYQSGANALNYFAGSLLSKKLVEANTAGSGSPNIITSEESNTVFTNEGATARNYHTLPTAVAGLTYTFVVQDADGIRITANTGDTIRISSVVSASAGYAESTTIGDTITLIAINATEWVATSSIGGWSLT